MSKEKALNNSTYRTVPHTHTKEMDLVGLYSVEPGTSPPRAVSPTRTHDPKSMATLTTKTADRNRHDPAECNRHDPAERNPCLPNTGPDNHSTLLRWEGSLFLPLTS